jgi:hypothetical protein
MNIKVSPKGITAQTGAAALFQKWFQVPQTKAVAASKMAAATAIKEIILCRGRRILAEGRLSGFARPA